MDYARHYSLLINRAIGRALEGYTEKHHILPRCMGGTDDAENLVRLTIYDRVKRGHPLWIGV